MPHLHPSSTPWDGNNLSKSDYRENGAWSGPAKHYFSTLPAYVQESIMQSGVDFSNEDELRSFVDNLGRRGGEMEFNDNGGME